MARSAHPPTEGSRASRLRTGCVPHWQTALQDHPARALDRLTEFATSHASANLALASPHPIAAFRLPPMEEVKPSHANSANGAESFRTF